MHGILSSGGGGGGGGLKLVIQSILCICYDTTWLCIAPAEEHKHKRKSPA